MALGPNPTASEAMVRQDMQQLKDSGGQFCGILAMNGEMMGVVDFMASGHDGNAQHAFIELVMIAKPYRGKGLGAAVVEQVEAAIKGQNPAVVCIYSAVQVNNPLALKFWQAQGYQSDENAALQPDGTTTYQLQKHL